MGGIFKDFLKRQFPADGLGWKIPSLVAAMMAIVAGAVALVVWARGTLSDLLTANVEVWHLLVAVGALIVVGLIVMRLCRPVLAQERARWPRELDRYGVKWPITAVRSGSNLEFRTGKPRCPECRTPLGLDSGEGNEPIQLPDNTWKEMPSEGMTFRCHKDGSAYDLTEYKLGMFLLTRNVEAEAQGEYSTALREAGE